MSSPAFTTDNKQQTRPLRRVLAALWTSLRTTNRDITTTLGISAALHFAVLLMFGTALYTSGEDEENIPELSVQIETREGPSSEEMTDAALPEPAPEPEHVNTSPGNSEHTVEAPVVADASPVQPLAAQDSGEPEQPAIADAEPTEEPVLTTTGESSTTVAMDDPDLHETPPAPVPETEQVMLTRNVTQLAQKLLDSNMTKSQLTWQQDGREYSARVIRRPAADSTGLEQVIAEVTTNKDGKRMKTHLSLKRLAFSHFTQLVNFWDPHIQLHDDVIEGRFHSNTEIGLAFTQGVEPRFFGKVTTAAAHLTLDEYNTRAKKKNVFQGGTETKVERVTLPRDMPDVINGGEQGDRQLFAGDTRIIFNSDGSFVWRLANGDGPLQRAESSQRPRYLIADKNSKLFVRGTVAGIFTVYSPEDIEIEGDLTYANDPRETLMSRDFLALIAGRDMRVAGTQVTGDGDLHIQAAMFARRRFIIESADRGKVGKLLILGSLTAGTILETEPRYATKLDFDKRFEYLRPAAFPMTRRYEVDSWDQDWQEVENNDPPAAPGLASSK